MSEQNAESEVHKIVNKMTSADVKVDSNLVENGYVDSLGIIQLVAAVEQKFEIDVPYSDVTLKNFGSVRDISEYLENRKNDRNA
jgi:acyl carrier protein